VLVMVVVAAGLLLVAMGHWRRGTGLMAVGAGLGALTRLVLPERLAGPLRVRSRRFDVTFFAVLTVTMAAAGNIGI